MNTCWCCFISSLQDRHVTQGTYLAVTACTQHLCCASLVHCHRLEQFVTLCSPDLTMLMSAPPATPASQILTGRSWSCKGRSRSSSGKSRQQQNQATRHQPRSLQSPWYVCAEGHLLGALLMVTAVALKCSLRLFGPTLHHLFRQSQQVTARSPDAKFT
jgi:hypothetical protein